MNKLTHNILIFESICCSDAWHLKASHNDQQFSSHSSMVPVSLFPKISAALCVCWLCFGMRSASKCVPVCFRLLQTFKRPGRVIMCCLPVHLRWEHLHCLRRSPPHTYTLLHIQCQYSWDTACHSISWHSVVKSANSVHHELVIILP